MPEARARQLVRRWIAGVLCLLASVRPASSSAVEPVVVRPDMTAVQLGRHLEFLEDEQGRWGLQDILRPEIARRFTPSDSDVPSFGFSTMPIWFHVELRGEVQRRQRMLLEIAFPMLDRVEVYVERSGGGFDRMVVGDHFPHGNKVISHSSFLFPFQISPGQRRQVYLRVQTEGALQLPLTLWTPQGFWDHEQGSRIAYGFYYGFMIIMIIYNLFLFIATRYRSYLLFVLYALSLLVYLATNDGMVQEYLLPAFPWWANRIVPISLSTAVGFAGLMTVDFFNLKGALPGWRRVLFWMSIVGLVCAVGAPFIPYNTVTRFAAFWVAPSTTMVLVVSVLAWRRGHQIARYYIFGWAIMVLGTVMVSFSRLGLIPRTQLTDFSWVIGMALNVVFISIALADRINPLKREREQVQAELREAYVQLAEHDRLKSNFFANVSHELRTPLTLILTPLAQLLGGQAGQLPNSVTERLRLMEGNTQRLLRLVNQLLDFSRLESGAMAVSYELIDVRPLVAAITEAFQPYARSKEISLSLRGDQDLPSVYTDPAKLEKTLGNLLSNACKFTDPGGQVVCRLSAEETSLEIAVIDTGIGIGRQDLPKLFERFSQVDDSSTRRYEGTGIGLALSQELVVLMGGKLTVQSEPGIGSTFTIRLPLGSDHIQDPSLIRASEKEQADSAPASGAAMALAAETGAALQHRSLSEKKAEGETRPLVIVVEDNPDLRSLVAEICAEDFEVLEAADGQQVLSQIEQRLPALIISDTMLPGMDGQELLRRLRSEAATAAIPVILLTAKADPQQRVDDLQQGADDYITKPFEARELLARARNLVRLQQQDAELHRLNQELQQEVVKQSSELTRMRVLGRFLPPQVMQRVLQEGQALDVNQERRRLTAFRLQLTGFDAFIESMAPEELAAMLNTYQSEMTDLAFTHGATVERFIRDTMVGFFGAPTSEGPEQDALSCAKMAVALWKEAAAFCQRWKELTARRPPVPTLVVATGHATCGTFGSSSRKEYTAIGGPVATAASLIKEASPGEVICTRSTWTLIEDEVDGESVGEITAPGSGRRISAFRLAGPLQWADDVPVLAQEEVRSATSSEDSAPTPQTESELKAGTVLAKRYRILRLLGTGGMGTVYLAKDSKLDAEVAIKLLRQDRNADPKQIDRLYREVRLARLVNHSNVAHIFDVSEWKGQEFISMEYIRGLTLRSRLAAGGPLPLGQGKSVLIQLCAGLGAAHSVGVVHRDLKPSNIMLEEPGGRVVILDFGIARWTAELEQTGSDSRTALGTPYYMSPEQFNDQPVDHRTDIYTVGVVAYELFTGKRPFIGATAPAVAYQHVHSPPPDPLKLRPDLAPRMAAVILRCLQKKPRDRFSSAGELRTMIEGVRV